MNDVLISKIESIQRCLERAREEYAKNPATFDQDYTRQDAAILNILRACEQTIDLANHLVRTYKMGIPNSSAESFDMLRQKAVINADLAGKLKKMTHFRNMIVHQYEAVEMDIVREVLQQGLLDLIAFTDCVLAYTRKPN